MIVKEVVHPNEILKFLQLPYRIYARDKDWIAPLESDIEAVFNPHKNPAFLEGEAIRWIVEDEQGQCIGRVAAFYHKKHLSEIPYPCGGMGFFECINHKETAFLLFDTCKHWLSEKGMKAMEGPVNFGERDKFWGLLVSNNTAPTYLENYHPSYYRDFFEAYGFLSYFEQLTYAIRPANFDISRFSKISRRLNASQGVSIKTFQPKSIDQFIKDFVNIYNDAWQNFENFKALNEQEVQSIFRDLKPILVPEFILYAYVNGAPAGFFILIPDVNQLFRFVHGKLNLIGKLKFIIHKYLHPVNRLKALVFGIRPAYRKSGLDASLLTAAYEQMQKFPRYASTEIAWIGSFNPKMQSMMQTIGAQVSKKHITYRKLFDNTIVFEKYKLKE